MKTARIIAIEGIDGSGKQTLTEHLCSLLRDQAYTVHTAAFPRYDAEPWGSTIRRALAGELEGLSDSVFGMAALFAADRAAWWQEEHDAPCDIWLVDRYVASNVAYGSARLVGRRGNQSKFQHWIEEVEFDQLHLPVPFLQVLTTIAPEVARDRRRGRQSEDAFEASVSLQREASRQYRALAERRWRSQWFELDPDPTIPAITNARVIRDRVIAMLRSDAR